MPDSSGCVPNCRGCREIWGFMAGPGVRRGCMTAQTRSLEDLAATVRHLMGFSNPFETGSPILEVLDEGAARVSDTRLLPARRGLRIAPLANPGRAAVGLGYWLPAPGPAEIRIFDVTGAIVARRVLPRRPTGEGRFTWNGQDDSARPAPSGAYVAWMRAGPEVGTCSLMLIR